MRAFNESPDVDVAFHGLVIDQDSNALQNVNVDISVTQWDSHAPPGAEVVTTKIESQTGPDGRFYVQGLKGHSTTVLAFTKDGYEPETGIRRNYGEYLPQVTSFLNPVVFKMWKTNLHEPLVAGERSFVITPDGRHYAIDLIKGSIAEGDDGDLVAWIKRPEKVGWRERYDWSCELIVPHGGLREDSNYYMFTAPETGYTNIFAHQQERDSHWWGVATGDKRFYIQLRNRQMYGRVTIGLFADYNAQTPGLIRISYAVNPSGSRLLR
jgi:hypothetical protein